MITCVNFANELHQALTHLHDSSYEPSRVLCDVAGLGPESGVLALRSSIIQAIHKLRPDARTPVSAQSRRVYEVLYNRFVLKLTQEETAERLHMSRSSVNRLQKDAIHALAGLVWERWQSRVAPDGSDVEAKPQSIDGVAADWQEQVERELASLQDRTPDGFCEVGEAIGDALRIVHALAATYRVCFVVKSVQPDLVAAVHPVLLRQILISCLERLARNVSSRWIDVYARLEDGNARITLTGTVDDNTGLSRDELVGDVPLPKDISLDVHLDGGQASVWITAPSEGRVTVLVVDDNEDMARLYRGAAVGTRYHVMHVAQGRDLAAVVESASPRIIVLDVMLPDIDGWTVLMQLRENPATRSIPVIISSVVREEQLARSLGAACYLAKPVRPREFIRALDRVLPLDS